MSAIDIAVLLCVGLIAGGLGGLLGIGGSIIMIPAMAVLLKWDFHLAQAIAMTVNPVVALFATLKHHRNKNVSWQTTKYVLPIATVTICFAAWLSNRIQSGWLELSFGIFLLWVLWNQVSSLRGKATTIHANTSQTPIRYATTGGITGTMAGFLGIGGGLIQVPLLNRLCGLKMKQAIGTSSSIMFITAICGATVKVFSLPSATNSAGELAGLQAIDALTHSFWLIPGAIIGAWFGAILTNIMPVRVIRIIFAILVAFASYKMIAGGSVILT